MSTVPAPRVTFYVQTYNQARFVAEAIAGALAQDCEDLEFIFCDDGSTDGTWEILQAQVPSESRGRPCRLVRNDTNIGIGASVSRVMALARGTHIVIAAGDDISAPSRARRLADALDAAVGPRKAYSAWSAASYIDDRGAPVARTFPGRAHFSDNDMAYGRHAVIGATHAWRREVFDLFGPLDPAVMFEDATVSFRSHLLGAIVYVPEPLVAYRVHDGNLTNYVPSRNHRELYASAARRATWAAATYRQKLVDLAHWEKVLFPTHRYPARAANLLEKGTRWMARRNDRRLGAYQKFPRLTLFLLGGALVDRELRKVLFRSLLG